MPDLFKPALFGKHPAWADHMPDFGGNAPITSFRQEFYIDGIGTCLGRQRWVRDGSAADAALPWNHGLLNIGPQGWIMAAAIASSDSRGRRQYPLVSVLAGQDWESLASTEAAGALLTGLLNNAAACTDESAVSSAHREATTGTAMPAAPPDGRLSFLETISPGEERTALCRVFHAIAPQASGEGRARVSLPAPHWSNAALWASLVRFILEDDAAAVTVSWR